MESSSSVNNLIASNCSTSLRLNPPDSLQARLCQKRKTPYTNGVLSPILKAKIRRYTVVPNQLVHSTSRTANFSKFVVRDIEYLYIAALQLPFADCTLTSITSSSHHPPPVPNSQTTAEPHTRARLCSYSSNAARRGPSPTFKPRHMHNDIFSATYSTVPNPLHFEGEATMSEFMGD